MVPFRSAALAALVVLVNPPAGMAPPGSQALRQEHEISERDLREYLTYIASDGLEGRAAYSEGLGLAAAYIARHIEAWGLQPGGDDGTYFQAVRNGARYSRNVIGILPGADPALRATHVAFGAHYDHIGVAASAAGAAAGGGDQIFNGADDDGSGTVALMAMARSFSQGPRPRRSLMFVWHTAEEGGLRGSRVNAARVDPEAIVAMLNIDMIGRNVGDDPAKGRQVFIIGADRISTELHNINEDANGSLPDPLELDYSLNDPSDPERLYTRSDHYSYALRGIPAIFFFTGLHADYHGVDDEVDRIDFGKLARVTRLVRETGWRLANADSAPARDNKGPRAGRGFSGRLQQ